MRFSNSLASLLVAGLSLASAGHAQQDDPCSSGSFGDRLRARYTQACVQKDASLAKRADAAREALKSTDERARIQAAGALAAWEAQNLPQAGLQPESAKFLESTRQALKRAEEQLASLPGLGNIDDDGGLKYRELQLAAWAPVANVRFSHGESYLRHGNCLAEAAADHPCAIVFARAVQIADGMYVMQTGLSALRQLARIELGEQLKARTARWNSYIFDTQFQYGWELTINRWLEEKCPSGPNSIAARLLDREKECVELKRDKDGNLAEWREPPSYRAVFIHPDVGVFYNRDAAKGDRTGVGLVFQWVGYQWWKWDKSNKVSDLRGLSIVSTVADLPARRSVGLGLQGQYGPYSLSLTSHGGKPMLMFSANLLDKLNSKDEPWAEKMREALGVTQPK